MANSVADLITESFIDLAVIQPGETITTDMLANAFRMLNQLIASLSVERTIGYLAQHTNYTLVAGTAVYTLGVGGTLNTAIHPVRATSWSSASGQFSSGGLVLSMDEFRVKTLNATARRSVLPELIGADQKYPLITIEVFPTPDTAPGTLRLDYWTPIPQFATSGDTVDLPDGYEAMLHFNLAVALAPQYARQGGVTPELAANAQNSKAVIASKNADILGLNQQQPAA